MGYGARGRISILNASSGDRLADWHNCPAGTGPTVEPSWNMAE
jgi:hypothetical protein